MTNPSQLTPHTAASPCLTPIQDKYRYDSERADLPARPVDIELDGNSLALPLVNQHGGFSRSSSRKSSSSLETTSRQRPLSPVASLSGDSPTPSVVKRDTVVKSFELQPSVFENGKFQNPWRNYKAPTFTSILKLGFSPNKSNISSKQVCLIIRRPFPLFSASYSGVPFTRT